MVGFVVARKVKDIKSFAEYARQEVGVPYPLGYEWAGLSRNVNQFFEMNPGADWQTLCRVVDFVGNRRWRFTHLNLLIAKWRYAWVSGYLPELDPKAIVDESLEEGILVALESEKDPKWRERLMATTGIEHRRVVFDEWLSERG